MTYALDQLDEAVRRFWAVASRYHIFLFHGEMGAGKTTFISALCRYLGSKDEASSPTFALINEYRFTAPGGAEQKIFHMDLYRMRSSQEAIMAGVEDCILHALAQSDFVFAEWPERAPGLFPDAAVVVCIELSDDSQRTLTLTVPHP